MPPTRRFGQHRGGLGNVPLARIISIHDRVPAAALFARGAPVQHANAGVRPIHADYHLRYRSAGRLRRPPSPPLPGLGRISRRRPGTLWPWYCGAIPYRHNTSSSNNFHLPACASHRHCHHARSLLGRTPRSHQQARAFLACISRPVGGSDSLRSYRRPQIPGRRIPSRQHQPR